MSELIQFGDNTAKIPIVGTGLTAYITMFHKQTFTLQTYKHCTVTQFGRGVKHHKIFSGLTFLSCRQPIREGLVKISCFDSGLPTTIDVLKPKKVRV